MKIHTGDLVVIITGKDKGKTGRVLRVLPERDRLVVAGANMRTRHVRKTPQAPGRVVRYEASLHVSNVMIVDPKTKKRSRIGMSVPHYAPDGASRGRKERIAKRSGEELLSGKKLKKLVEEEGKNEKNSSDSSKSSISSKSS